ncbi:MAG TPA: hypothetical protein PKG60_13270 [Spirochaetota bacterium]|nr:hypothetical protein [Spirochaetota bacterium]HPS87335.1 hypothetical protein [Spirochaetota bacterium]
MKKLFFIVGIFFFSITSSFAVFFIDAKGDYITTGDFEPVTGFGLGIGFDLTDDVNFLIRCSTATNTENKGAIDEMRYDYSTVTGGIEYIPSIPALDNYRIHWKNSLNLGASMFELDVENATDGKDSETGFIASFCTGLQFDFTQTVAPFFDLGYHKSFYSSTSDLSINGWQAALGVRFFICGSRNYDAGY